MLLDAGIRLVGALLLVGGCAYAVESACSLEESASVEDENEVSEAKVDREPSRMMKGIYAWSACKEAIRPKFKSPSSAEFAPVEEVNGGPNASEDGHWLVTGWVSATNSFNARIRKQATCKLDWLPDEDDFKVLRAGVVDR